MTSPYPHILLARSSLHWALARPAVRPPLCSTTHSLTQATTAPDRQRVNTQSTSHTLPPELPKPHTTVPRTPFPSTPYPSQPLHLHLHSKLHILFPHPTTPQIPLPIPQTLHNLSTSIFTPHCINQSPPPPPNLPQRHLLDFKECSRG